MLTLKERCKIVAWMEVLQSVIAVQQRFRALYGPGYTPDRNTIINIHRKFMKTGSVMDRRSLGRPRIGQNDENVATVREAFDFSQGKSTRRAILELNTSATSIQRILRRELRIFSYKIQVVQKLESQDHNNRVAMCEALLDHFLRHSSIMEQM